MSEPVCLDFTCDHDACRVADAAAAADFDARLARFGRRLRALRAPAGWPTGGWPTGGEDPRLEALILEEARRE